MAPILHPQVVQVVLDLLLVLEVDPSPHPGAAPLHPRDVGHLQRGDVRYQVSGGQVTGGKVSGVSCQVAQVSGFG